MVNHKTIRDKKIAITGANGYVAKNLRRILDNAGISAVCLARKNFSTHPLETKIVSSNYDPDKILPLLKNCTAMVHLAGSGIQSVDSDYCTSNVNLTKKMTELCYKSKIKRFVYNSGLGASAKSTTGYFISKYQSEQIVRKSGLDYVIFRPSYIMGQGDAFTTIIKKQKKNGRIIIPGSGKYRMQPIYILDACNILLDAALLRKYSKKVLDLTGLEIISFQDFLKKAKLGKYIVKTNLEDEYRLAIRGRGKFNLDDLCIMVGDYTGNVNPLKKLYGQHFTSLDEMLNACGF